MAPLALSPERLLHVEGRPRRKAGDYSRALVPLQRGRCPHCGAPTATTVLSEPALFYFGGYGATRRTTRDHCTGSHCHWAMTVEVTEVNPRHH